MRDLRSVTALSALLAVAAAQICIAEDSKDIEIQSAQKDAGSGRTSAESSGLFRKASDEEAQIGAVSFEVGREFVHARVEEDGCYFVPQITVSGSRGRAIQIAVWSNDGWFLGERRVVPPYDSTTWQNLKVFVPWSRLRKVNDNPFGYTVYAVPYDRPDQYIGLNKIPQSHLTTPDITWEWMNYTTAGSEFIANLAIRVAGHKDERIQFLGLVRNGFYRDFPASYGGPIRVDIGWAQPRYADTEFAEVTLRVPYSKLANLAPSETVTVTPALEMNGATKEGNVHFRFLAAGSIDQVERNTHKQIDEANGALKSLQRELAILRQRAGR
jgi:hypothetical protein